MRVLTFYKRYLEPVQEGRKRATIRKARTVANLRPGDPLRLAFGSWAKPHVIDATCTAVEPLDPDQLTPKRRTEIIDLDGITAQRLDELLADPEPKVLIRFTVHPTSAELAQGQLWGRRSGTSP